MKTHSKQWWFVILTLVALTATEAMAEPLQNPQQPELEQSAGGKLEFEVASVKPSPPMTPFSTNIGNLDGLDGPVPRGNLFRANAPVMAYILFAFKITDSVNGRSIFDHLPGWAKAQFFDVEARASGVHVRDQLRLMVQALLANRFKLAVHRETQRRDEGVLVLATAGKIGPQLRPDSAEPCVTNPSGSMVIPAPEKLSDAPRYCGIVTWNTDAVRHIRMIDVTTAQIANYLASASMSAGGSIAPHAGVDGTGLTGRYDLDFQFAPGAEAADSADIPSGPEFADALKHQLGLKLVERKGSVEVLVLDHIEEPSEN
ncbi:MAG: TIGR03435 family protein [Bryobacteraceae bacterium]